MTDRRPRRIFVVLKRSLFSIHIFVTLGLLACRVDLKKIRPTERSQIIEFLKEHSLSAQNVFFPAPEERKSFITLPRLRLVDEKGRLYFERSGYSEDAADELLRAARERKVSGQIVFPHLITIDGAQVSLEDLPEAELYILEDWASWCAPCPHLMKQIEGMLAQQPPGLFFIIKICHYTFENDSHLLRNKTIN